MTIKSIGLAITAALAAFVFVSPVNAAMPVTGATMPASDSSLVQIAAKKKKMTRRQEIDRSIDSGTVPSRYRGSVPREYQQYVPFEKRR